MIWPFNRKPKSPPDMRHMNEDWKVGDVAVCTADAWPFAGPEKGSVLAVTGIREAVGTHGPMKGALAFFLTFSEYGDTGFICVKFRKQRPNEAEAIASWKEMLSSPQPVLSDTLEKGEVL